MINLRFDMGYYHQEGFTLIEVVMIIVIIAIMSTVAIRSMQPITERTREEGTMREMDLLAEAICGDKDVVVEGIRADYGYVGDVGSLPPDLDALVTNPGGYSTWKGPYIRSAFNENPDDYKRDAWNQLYSYTGGVKIISTGGGDTLTKQFAQNASGLTSNTVWGNIYDGLGGPPGDSAFFVTVTVLYPDGSGGSTSVSTSPSSAGRFTFANSIPVGNHLIRAVYSTAGETTAAYVSVPPASACYRELRFSRALWPGGGGEDDSLCLWLTTREDVSSSGVPELPSWTAGEILNFGRPSLAFEPGKTQGTFSSVFNLDNMVQDGEARVDAIHFVRTNMTVGSANRLNLYVGDVLLSTMDNETLSSTNTLSVNDEDVFVFRPDIEGDYSSATFIFLLDGHQIITTDIQGVSLVEADTEVGGTTLLAGTFLLTQTLSDKDDIFHYTADDVGLNTTSGTLSILIDGSDIDIGGGVNGLDLVESTTALGGTTLQAGWILISQSADDACVGDNCIRTMQQDISYLIVTQAGSDTVADAELFLDGSDLNLDTTEEDISGLSLSAEEI